MSWGRPFPWRGGRVRVSFVRVGVPGAWCVLCLCVAGVIPCARCARRIWVSMRCTRVEAGYVYRAECKRWLQAFSKPVFSRVCLKTRDTLVLGHTCPPSQLSPRRQSWMLDGSWDCLDRCFDRCFQLDSEHISKALPEERVKSRQSTLGLTIKIKVYNVYQAHE